MRSIFRLRASVYWGGVKPKEVYAVCSGLFAAPYCIPLCGPSNDPMPAQPLSPHALQIAALARILGHFVHVVSNGPGTAAQWENIQATLAIQRQVMICGWHLQAVSAR
jgi:hypothetical protein